MNPCPHSPCRVGIRSLIVLCLALAGSGAPAEAQPIATVSNNATMLNFTPVVEYERLVLTVTGPCDFVSRQTTTGNPSFSVGTTTIDGAYTYHLLREESVDPSVVQVLNQARAAGNEETAKQLCRDGILPGTPLSQSEGFRIVSGQIVYTASSSDEVGPEAPGGRWPSGEGADGFSGGGPLPPDQVINDDLIVQGSACIGTDCVDGEVFGADTTLKLKENILRVLADDQSTTMSFPRTDWRLVFNEVQNGGANKFSVEDVTAGTLPFTLQGGARSHSLVVDGAGKIGSRIATPIMELHAVDGDTPRIRLEQDSTLGYAARTWDVGANETTFFVRDISGATVPLQMRSGAPSDSIHVSSVGNVGIGTGTPTVPLEVAGAAIINGDFSVGSSRTIKRNFAPVDRREILERLRALPVESWSYREGEPAVRHLGPVAEDFRASFGLGKSEKHISPADAAGVALAALQGVLELLAERDAEVARLKERVERLEEQKEEDA